MRRISTNSEFEKSVGYSRAVVDEHYVHVSGTTGFDYETMTISDDPAEQAHQAFANIARALAAAAQLEFERVSVEVALALVDAAEALHVQVSDA